MRCYFFPLNVSKNSSNLYLSDHTNTKEYQSSLMTFVLLTTIVSFHLFLARTKQVEARTPKQNTKGAMQMQILISKWRYMLFLMKLSIKMIIFHFSKFSFYPFFIHLLSHAIFHTNSFVSNALREGIISYLDYQNFFNSAINWWIGFSLST